MGNGVFAWTMFSKSETYRMHMSGWTADGAARAVDPRAIAPHVSPSIGYFLPAPDTWRHDPVGLLHRDEIERRVEAFVATHPHGGDGPGPAS